MTAISKFKNANLAAVGNSFTQIYQAPSGKDSYFLQLDIASVGISGVQVSVRIYDDSASSYTYLVKQAPVPVGSSLQVLDGQKLVLESLDKVEVICDTSGETVDVTSSLIEDVNS